CLLEYSHGLNSVIFKPVFIIDKPVELVLSSGIDIITQELLVVTKSEGVGFIRIRRPWDKSIPIRICLVKNIVLLTSQIMFSHIVFCQIAPNKFCRKPFYVIA